MLALLQQVHRIIGATRGRHVARIECKDADQHATRDRATTLPSKKCSSMSCDDGFLTQGFGATKRTHPCVLGVMRAREDSCNARSLCKLTAPRYYVAFQWPISPSMTVAHGLTCLLVPLRSVWNSDHVLCPKTVYGNEMCAFPHKKDDVEGSFRCSLEKFPNVFGTVHENGRRHSCPLAIVQLNRNATFQPRTRIAYLYLHQHIFPLSKEATVAILSFDLLMSQPWIFKKFVFLHKLNHCAVQTHSYFDGCIKRIM